MRKNYFPLIMFLLILPSPMRAIACPPTGSHIGVIIDEVLDVNDILDKLSSLNVEARYESLSYQLKDGGSYTFNTVVFNLGCWFPLNPSEGGSIKADARLYVGEKSMALKVNTSISGSSEPLKRALVILLRAGIISHLPEQDEFILTEGNVVPPDVIVLWAKEEYNIELKQEVMRCKVSGAEVTVPSLESSSKVVVLANSIDAELSYPTLRDALINLGYEPMLIGPEEFQHYVDARFIFVLGGPDAYEGVGNISEFIIPLADSSYLRSVKDSYIKYLASPLFKGQKIIVLAGYDRYATKRAVKEFIELDMDKTVRDGAFLTYEFSANRGLVPDKPPTGKKAPVVVEYPCLLFIELFSTLPTPCYKPEVSFQIQEGRIDVIVNYVRLPVVCIEVIALGDLRIFIHDIPPGNYELHIVTPQGEFKKGVSIPSC